MKPKVRHEEGLPESPQYPQEGIFGNLFKMGEGLYFLHNIMSAGL